MSKIEYDIVRKKACHDIDKLCYHLNPYSMVDIANDKKHTKKEKELNVKRYQTSCSNRNGIIQKCCSKNKSDIAKLDKLLAKLKKPAIYGKPTYNQQGELESLKICSKDKLKDCGKGFQKLNSYEMCKIPDDVNLEISDGENLTSFVKDCHLAQCNPQEKLAKIDGTFNMEYTYEFDKQVSQSIRSNKLANLKYYLKEDPKLTSRALTNSIEGNTIYHESFKYDAKHIIVFLFKTITRDAINRLNSVGETVLHMAMKTENPNAISMCLKFGANINAVNNLGETPIFNAIRNGHYNNTLVALNRYADIYHKNKKGETPFIIGCTVAKRKVDIVRLLVNNGANIDDKNTEGKTILNSLLEKEEINEKKLTAETKKEKGKLDLNIEDEKIRTLLQNIKIKKLGLDLSQELSEEDTRKLEGILYVLTDKDKYPNKKTNFKMKVNFDTNLKYPEDLHYPSDLEENYMKPYNTGELNFSHEPYYLKYKNMHQDKLVILKKVIQLSKWDSQKTEDEKLKIVDDIMTGKISFDSYKYRVFNENGITQEQDHLLENIDENTLFDFKKPESNKKIVSVKAKRTIDNKGEITNTPFNIDYKTESELIENQKAVTIDDIIDSQLKTDYEELLLSPDISQSDKDSLLNIIKKIVESIAKGITGESKELNELSEKTNELKKKRNFNLDKMNKKENKLLAGIILIGIVTLIIFLYLVKQKKINLNIQNVIKNYGG